MKHRTALWPRLVRALVALSLLIAACNTAQASQEEPIRIGVNLWVGYDLLEVAEQEGFFAAEGLDVEIVDFTSLSDVAAAFQRGQIDGMATTINEVLEIRSETARSPQIVLITDYSDGADVIVAGPGIESVADLAGAAVAAESPLGPFILSRALATVGLELDDVDLVLADQLELPGLVATRRVTAAVSFPPISLDLERDHGFRQIFTTADIPGEVIDVVSIDSNVLARHPELPAAVRRAWDRSIERLAEEPESTILTMANREGISIEEMSGLLTEVELLTWTRQATQFADGTLEAACRQSAEVLVRLGMISAVAAASDCSTSIGVD